MDCDQFEIRTSEAGSIVFKHVYVFRNEQTVTKPETNSIVLSKLENHAPAERGTEVIYILSVNTITYIECTYKPLLNEQSISHTCKNTPLIL